MPIPASDEETEDFMETTQIHEVSAGKTDLDEAALLYDKLMQGLVSADQVCQNNVMAKSNDALQEKKEHLKSSRTAACNVVAVHGHG